MNACTAVRPPSPLAMRPGHCLSGAAPSAARSAPALAVASERRASGKVTLGRQAGGWGCKGWVGGAWSGNTAARTLPWSRRQAGTGAGTGRGSGARLRMRRQAGRTATP